MRDIKKQREYQKLWMRKRRAEYFQNKKCKWCGSTIKLELHHKNPKDKISHSIWSWNEVRRNAEIEKCIVLCKKCHSAFHHPPKPLIHGTSNAYNQKKCRCEKCCKWQYDYDIDYKKRKQLQI